MKNRDFHALIIGISRYQRVMPLPPVVLQDVQDIYTLLTDPAYCGYPGENVQILMDSEATKDGILKALEVVAQHCDEESSALIYISSHGGQIETGPYAGEYLLPVEANSETERLLASSAISGDQFTDCLRTIRARKLVVIFDCCHSGGIGQPKEQSSPLFKSGLPDNYYNELKSGRGRVIFASSRSDELSWIMPRAQNSLFTKYLLDGLRGGAAGQGGIIRVFDLFDYIQPRVVSDQPKQHPIFKAEIEENFPIALFMGGSAATPIPEHSPKNGLAYDVFISYRHREPEKTWVRRTLLPALESYGLKACIDYRDFRLGALLVHEMERAVEQSRYTLAVLTPSYLTSNFTDLENILAEHLGLEKGQHRLLIILREECKPRIGLRARLWLDMTENEDFETNIIRLAYEIRQAI